MNRCACGSTFVIVDAQMVQHEDGSWAGCELLAIRCEQCGAPVRLDAVRTVALMHQLIEEREAGRGERQM